MRLWDEGVRGKMWRVIREMYRTVQSSVLVDGEQTEMFELNMGVRQGCVIFVFYQWVSERDQGKDSRSMRRKCTSEIVDVCG